MATQRRRLRSHLSAQISPLRASSLLRTNRLWAIRTAGSSVSSGQEFLTEGDDLIRSPLRQPDSARDRARLGRSSTSAFAGGRW
jgi:hypothetical protein